MTTIDDHGIATLTIEGVKSMNIIGTPEITVLTAQIHALRDDPRLLAEVHLLSAVVHTTLTARLLRDHRSGLLRPELDPRRLPDLAWSLAQGLLVRIVSDPALPWRELLNDACTALIRGAQDPSAIRHS